MDAELYTVLDAIMFYLLYFRYLIFGLFFILDIHLFSKWRTAPVTRPFALLLALCLLAAVLWQLAVFFS